MQFQADKRINIFKLTSTGNKIAKTHTDNWLSSELKALDILNKFENKELKDIISFSYFWYPKTAINSKIRDDNFEKKSIFSNLEGDLEKEYNSIINSGYSVKDVIRESWRCYHRQRKQIKMKKR